jgi:deoxyribodipyrimidine photo-lyase
VTTSVVVFTRDLRVTDIPALAAAARSPNIVPLFVFDDVILRRHEPNATRLAFLLASLRDLDASLRARGGRLVIRRGPWAATVLDLAVQAGAESIHLAADVSGYARRRLATPEQLGRASRREVVTHPGTLTAGPVPISPAGGGPYQIFTPYYRRWLTAPRRTPAAVPARIAVPDEIRSDPIPDLADLTGGRPAAAPPPGGEPEGLRRLSGWSGQHLAGYAVGRAPARQGTRFDPRGQYVRRYVPELDGLGADQIHDPAPGIRAARRYPRPIVDHQAAAAAWRALGKHPPMT